MRLLSFLRARVVVRGAGKGNGHPSDSAAIVNLGSINSYVTYPPATGLSDGFNPYPHGKGAVLQISKDMGVQLASENIRVNAVCPSPETPLAMHAAPPGPGQLHRLIAWSFAVRRPGVHQDRVDRRAPGQPAAQQHALCPPRPGATRGAARGCELDRVPLLRGGLLHHRPGCAPAGQACTCSTNLCLHNQQPGAALGSGVCGLRVGRTCVCSAGYLIDGGYTSC